MIKSPQTNQFKINVLLKNGEYYENKDITERPFGGRELVVSFWHENKIRLYSLQDVEYCELVEEINE